MKITRLLLLPVVLVNFAVNAQENDCVNNSKITPKRLKVGKINIINNPIFDETDPDTIAIHRLANWMHINTKQELIKERLSFIEGDLVSEADIEEAERIIRSESYVREAKVKIVKNCDDDSVAIEVKTWDNWSLIPTLSFGRKGGENKFAIGVKEDNLLGLGIRARVQYKSDAQRTGYQFSLRFPISVVRHSTISFDFIDNDDGQRTQLTFDKPFYQLSTENSFYASYLSDKRSEQIFQNGGTRNEFLFAGHTYDLAVGKLWDRSDETTSRFTLGVTKDQAIFNVPLIALAQDSTELPIDRNFLFPWIQFEYKQSDYKIMNDIYLINQSEDINLGWAHTIKLGVETNDIASGQSLGYHLNTQSTKGYLWGSSLLLFGVNLESTYDVGAANYFNLSSSLEYFQRMSETIGLYGKFSTVTSRNQYADTPVALGGDSGVRGYSLQYQHGEHAALLSAEVRFYPQINLYKLLDVGFVGFFDAGRAWASGNAKNNEVNGIISSAGVGARIYSNRSSHRNVIHIDFAKPFADGPNVDSWQWRLQIKDTF